MSRKAILILVGLSVVAFIVLTALLVLVLGILSG